MRETLTEWIVDDACRIASQMHHKGLGALAINASGHELMAAGFRDIIANALNRYRLPPSQLVVEVTETVFVDNSSALFTLQEIADLGVRIALDDFGTGFSSLNHLRQMPAPIVKLDRSYTSCLGVGTRTTAILEALVSLTAALGQVLVAEGIDEQHQLDEVRAAGVTQGQGFFLGRPVPEAECFSTAANTVPF
jgi:EAL domain-containing protein (putative c-di-GMP-specific phosphodiesterase class I)